MTDLGSSKSQQSLIYVSSTVCCCCYRKGTNFQANHNSSLSSSMCLNVVVATAKVQIFKQITTASGSFRKAAELLLLPQRYKFSSKSQLSPKGLCGRTRCCCYRKGTNFQANHNRHSKRTICHSVVVATAKVQIFKQITTPIVQYVAASVLLLLPQRYKFSSKSQPSKLYPPDSSGCCCYRKGTNFQANHNVHLHGGSPHAVVVATAKVQIFKQITTLSWTGCS